MSVPVIYMDSVDSTNTEAKRLIHDHQISSSGQGCVLVADTQTQGRGRGVNHWHSELGGLYYTFVQAPLHIAVAEIPFLSRLVGEKVQQVIFSLTGVLPLVEWPNDLILDDRKVGGILIETVSHSGSELPRFVIVGIGINLNQEMFPQALAPIAISLRQFTGKTYNKQDFIDRLTKELQTCL